LKKFIAGCLLSTGACATPITHNDIMLDIEEVMAEQKFTIDNQLDICLWDEDQWDCERFSDHTNSAFVTSIYSKKSDKKPSTDEGGRSGIKTVLKTVKLLSGAGVKVSIDNIKINADGSYEIIGIDFHAGVGSGTPVPGQNDDGQQVHRN